MANAIADAIPGRKLRAEGCIAVGDATVVWCYGHLLELEEPHKGASVVAG
ncbi:MAG: hypothetical protein ACRDNF_09495 [Streptosporangiaceae bacterium]